MSEQNYHAMLRWFRSHGTAKNVLFWVSKAAVWAVYGIYLGLLAWMAYHAMWTQLLPAALVPARPPQPEIHHAQPTDRRDRRRCDQNPDKHCGYSPSSYNLSLLAVG